jgi:hypothetical protein
MARTVQICNFSGNYNEKVIQIYLSPRLRFLGGEAGAETTLVPAWIPGPHADQS